jgi:hypothetical protein
MDEGTVGPESLIIYFKYFFLRALPINAQEGAGELAAKADFSHNNLANLCHEPGLRPANGKYSYTSQVYRPFARFASPTIEI